VTREQDSARRAALSLRSQGVTQPRAAPRSRECRLSPWTTERSGTRCEGSGPPLICLHGGWQDSTSWRPQIRRFADEYSVVTFDLRGHGRTGPTGTRRYSIDLFADDLERLLGHLGIERPTLAGLSIGGMVVQAYLDRHPNGARGG